VDEASTRVLLIGLMGTGKTALGRAIEARTGWPYLDNDELLATANASDLVTLSTRGPDALHALEAAVLRQVLAHPAPLVAGVAAGVIEDAAVRSVLRDEAFSVYLRAAPATLARRVGEGAGRPYLQPDPLAALERMFATRDPLFTAVARLVVDVDDADPEQLAETILAALD